MWNGLFGIFGVVLLVNICASGCGKKDNTDETPVNNGTGDAYPTEPAEALLVGEKKTISNASLKSMGLWGAWNHGLVKRYSFTIAEAGLYKFDTYFSTTCVGVNKAAGKVGDAIYTLRDGGNSTTVIATSRVGDPMQVPSFEIPGKLAAASYFIDMMWVATDSNCSVSGDFTLLVDESSASKNNEKFPPIRLTLGAPRSYSGTLVEDGGSGLWVPFDIDQSFRFVVSKPANVTLTMTGVETNCKDSGYLSQYSVYDFQMHKSLTSGEFVPGDRQLDLGELDLGLYQLSLVKGADESCNVSLKVTVDAR